MFPFRNCEFCVLLVRRDSGRYIDKFYFGTMYLEAQRKLTLVIEVSSDANASLAEGQFSTLMALLSRPLTIRTIQFSMGWY